MKSFIPASVKHLDHHCKNEFVILTDKLLPQLHLHFQYIVRNMKYKDN